MQTESRPTNDGLSVEVRLTGFLAKMRQQGAGSWRWIGELHNQGGFERALSYVHSPELEKAEVRIEGLRLADGTPEPPFAKRLTLRIWQAVQNVEPDEPRYYTAQHSEAIRPALQQMGREHAHWRTYAVVPEPSPEKLGAMVAGLFQFGVEARATISVTMGAVLAVDTLKHGRTPQEVDFLVSVAVMGTERE